MLGTQVGDQNPCLVFLHNADDLLFRKAAALHVLVVSMGQNELQSGLGRRGNVRLQGRGLFNTIRNSIDKTGSLDTVRLEISGLIAVSSSQEIGGTVKRRPGRKAEVDRDGWIEKGLSELGRLGHGALTLDSLCARLGVTKGSFYWHFSGRAEFMSTLVETWEKRETLALIQFVEEQGGTPLEKLAALVQAANSGRVDFNIEQAIRHWGRSDALIRQMLQATDLKRIAFMESLFRQLHGSAELAHTQTTLLYSLIMGEPMIYKREDRARRFDRRANAFSAIIALSEHLGVTSVVPVSSAAL